MRLSRPYFYAFMTRYCNHNHVMSTLTLCNKFPHSKMYCIIMMTDLFPAIATLEQTANCELFKTSQSINQLICRNKLAQWTK